MRTRVLFERREDSPVAVTRGAKSGRGACGGMGRGGRARGAHASGGKASLGAHVHLADLDGAALVHAADRRRRALGESPSAELL